MNKREAVAVQGLLDWALALNVFEVDPARTDMADEEVVRLIGLLADRSHAALGAGLGQGEAIAAAVRLFGLDGAPEHEPIETPNQRTARSLGLEDVPPNAGSAS